MIRTLIVAVVGLALAGPVAAQESKAAAATRKKLQQKVTISTKETGLKAFLEEMNLELKQEIRIKIDNGSGVSNNMKVSFKGKDVTVEKLLNDLADKYDFGYIVVSNVSNNKEDGAVVIRKTGKGKERGYEAGKEPKDKSSALPRRDKAPVAQAPVFDCVIAAAPRRVAV